MRLEVKSIVRKEGTIRNGKNQGEEYVVYNITLGPIGACGSNLIRGIHDMVSSRNSNDAEIFQFLETLERETADEHGREVILIETFVKACKEKQCENRIYWETNIGTPAGPGDGCKRWIKHRMNLGQPGEQWVLIDPETGAPQTRTIGGIAQPIIVDAIDAYSIEQYDAWEQAWEEIQSKETYLENERLRYRPWNPNATTTVIDSDAEDANTDESSDDESAA